MHGWPVYPNIQNISLMTLHFETSLKMRLQVFILGLVSISALGKDKKYIIEIKESLEEGDYKYQGV